MVKLVLIRHGQSMWNLENRFTGWVDVSLSPKGLKEAQQAAKLLQDMNFDLAFTSLLTRAQQTLFEILNKNNHCNKYTRIHQNHQWYNNFTHVDHDDKELKVFLNDALNERYYGDLQGLNKDETRAKYGEEQVHIWRRSFDNPPPNGEALKDTYERTIPYFKKHIEAELKKGKNIIVSAHGNSLRAIMMYLENISGEDIMKVELGTAVPYIYELDENRTIVSKEILTLE